MVPSLLGPANKSGDVMTLVKLTRPHRGVAVLTLDRPDKRNAINRDLARDFAEAVATIEHADISVAVLEAQGPIFCAGVDLGELPESADALDSMVDLLLARPIHWTAKVQRPVLGGGLALLAACPRVVSTPEASFGLPELARGFFPSALMPAQIVSIGLRPAFGLALGSRPIDAPTALRHHLVSEICSADEVDSMVDVESVDLASRSVDALRAGVANWQHRVRHATRLLDSGA